MLSHLLPTLRSRLTILYMVSTTLIFLLLSSLFSVLLWVALHNQIDHHIHIVTTQAEQVVTNFEGEQRELLLNNLVQMGGMSVLMVTQDGRAIMQKNSADISPLNESEIQEVLAQSDQIGFHPIHFSIHNQRFGSATVKEDGTSLLLAVGYSTEILKQTFTRMIGIVVGVIVFTLLPLTYIGHRLLRKYLYPLEVVADTAQQINHPKKLSRRVTELSLTQEVATIVSSFNAMLSRLEHIFKTEHEFFSDAAHTLKTPLAVLRAKVEGLTQESDSKKQEILKIIDSAVDTVQDLLLISRIETGGGEPSKKVNISEAVRDLVEIAGNLAEEKKVRVTSEITEGLILKLDERLIKKAVGNVIHNAVLYVNQGGTIHVSLNESDDFILLQVTNSGGHLSQDEIKKVFDRFYRGKNSQLIASGSGLGLAITAAIVESYTGKIRFENDTKNQIKVSISLQK